VLACRVLASRGVPSNPAAVAAAAAAAAATHDLVRRVTARAVREASSSARGGGGGGGGGGGFSSLDGGGAWSRALWSDLASLAAPNGALSRHFSREDAAAELLRAQLRVGGGAERSVTVRRILHGRIGTFHVILLAVRSVQLVSRLGAIAPVCPSLFN
jgi:hypothetical protein